MKLHTGDTVLVISGKDKGKTGSILRVLPEENRVVVAGVNIRTRHMKKTHQQAGRILKYEASLSASNVMVLDPKTGKPARIGYKVDDKGKKIRVSRISGEEIKNVKPKVEKKEKTKKNETNEKSSTKDSSQSSSSSRSSSSSKVPFWKKMVGAGAEAGDVKEAPHMQEDHSIPDQQMHVRSGGGRGS